MRARHLSFLVAVAGCYDVPKPDCGFVCGSGGECPAGYSCNATDNRCHRGGMPFVCESGFDAAPEIRDRISPQVTAFTPAAGARDVPLSTEITVTFSERIIGASPITIQLSQAGVPVPSTVEFDLATNTATLTPQSLLSRSLTYQVTVNTDLIDLAGNELAGPTTWTFDSSSPPSLLTRSPTNLAIGVPVDASVTADFNEAIFGVTSGSFAVALDGVPVPGSLGVTNLNQRVVFTPTGGFAGNTTYTVILSTGIVDGIGHPVAGAPVGWSFTTGADTKPPMIVTQSPVSDDPNVPVFSVVTIQFDEPMIIDATSFTLTQEGTPVAATVVLLSQGRLARLRPDVDLLPGTTYTVTLTAAATDLAGNAVVGAPLSYVFTTESP